MKLCESNATTLVGRKKGYSGFLKPENYIQYVKWVAGVCEKTTGYTMSEFADNVENALVSGDYKTVYKHYYYVDKSGNLQDTDSVDNDAEGVDIEDNVKADLTV